jgi:hypothetical protein
MIEETGLIKGVLIRAGDVPEGAKITKLTGQKTYCVEKVLRIFYEGNKPPQIINAEEGVVFLVNGKDTNAVSVDKLVMWRPLEQELIDFLEYETPQ